MLGVRPGSDPGLTPFELTPFESGLTLFEFVSYFGFRAYFKSWLIFCLVSEPTKPVPECNPTGVKISSLYFS